MLTWLFGRRSEKTRLSRLDVVRGTLTVTDSSGSKTRFALDKNADLQAFIAWVVAKHQGDHLLECDSDGARSTAAGLLQGRGNFQEADTDCPGHRWADAHTRIFTRDSCRCFVRHVISDHAAGSD